MKFSELVASSGHNPEHIKIFTIAEGEGRVDRIKKNPLSLVFCENINEAEALVAVAENGMAVEFVPYDACTDAVKEAALQNNPSAFQFMKGSSDEIIDLALSLDGDNLMYLDTEKKTKQRCIDAVARHPSAIKYCNDAVFDPEDEEVVENQAQAADASDSTSSGY